MLLKGSSIVRIFSFIMPTKRRFRYSESFGQVHQPIHHIPVLLYLSIVLNNLSLYIMKSCTKWTQTGKFENTCSKVLKHIPKACSKVQMRRILQKPPQYFCVPVFRGYERRYFLRSISTPFLLLGEQTVMMPLHVRFSCPHACREHSLAAQIPRNLC